MKKLFYIALLLMSTKSFSQGENNIWYFDMNCGMDFNSGSPVTLTNGATGTYEGTSCISDASGAILFYSDGITVWNRNHVPMPNGTGLFGDNSSSQAALIVPKPGSTNIYFLFTTSAFGFGGAYYSEVDMNLNGGLGDVNGVKNIMLYNTTTEKLIATKTQNCGDYWVVSHFYGNDAFYAYQVTAGGVNMVPVITNIGCVTGAGGGNDAVGCAKFNATGDKIAIAHRLDTLQLFDFDKSTGVLSNTISLTGFTTAPTYAAYGVEFSASGRYLYASEEGYGGSNLYQYDLISGVQATIEASRITIGNFTSSFGALAMGPDGKIYAAREGATSAAVINFPENAGLACGYDPVGINLLGGAVHIGLVDQINDGCLAAPPVINFIASDRYICPNTCIDFTNFTTGATSYVWTFPGGMPSTSTDVNPAFICYDTPGNYSVTLVATNSVGSDSVTLNNMIHVYPQPGTPVITQVGNSLIATPGFATYQWYFISDTIQGATNNTYYGQQNGNYNLAVTDSNGCAVGVGILNVIFEPDGFNELTMENRQFTISPNPATDNITLTIINCPLSIVHFEIYNSIGKQVYLSEEKNVSGKFSKEISLNDFAKGVYNIKMITSSDVAVKKFMIER